jgi:hypothetical protein
MVLHMQVDTLHLKLLLLVVALFMLFTSNSRQSLSLPLTKTHVQRATPLTIKRQIATKIYEFMRTPRAADIRQRLRAKIEAGDIQGFWTEFRIIVWKLPNTVIKTMDYKDFMDVLWIAVEIAGGDTQLGFAYHAIRLTVWALEEGPDYLREHGESLENYAKAKGIDLEITAPVEFVAAGLEQTEHAFHPSDKVYARYYTMGLDFLHWLNPFD